MMIAGVYCPAARDTGSPLPESNRALPGKSGLDPMTPSAWKIALIPIVRPKDGDPIAAPLALHRRLPRLHCLAQIALFKQGIATNENQIQAHEAQAEQIRSAQRDQCPVWNPWCNSDEESPGSLKRKALNERIQALEVTNRQLDQQLSVIQEQRQCLDLRLQGKRCSFMERFEGLNLGQEIQTVMDKTQRWLVNAVMIMALFILQTVVLPAFSLWIMVRVVPQQFYYWRGSPS
jgi:hypothetical protein